MMRARPSASDRSGTPRVPLLAAVAAVAGSAAYAVQEAPTAPGQYTAIATLTVQPGQEERFRQIMRTNVALSRREPGVIYYNAFQATNDPRIYVNVEVYRSEAAFQAHLHAPFVRRTMADFEGVLTGPPDVRTDQGSDEGSER